MASLTINGAPVVIDFDRQVADFLADRIPVARQAFPRNGWQGMPPYTSAGMEWLYLPYPDLPPIGINHLQWPTGASRYGRALLLIDWDTLTKIWPSYAAEEGEPGPAPIDWLESSWPDCTQVEVQWDDGERLFRAKMYPLAPIPVAPKEAGIALWLLPLVDARALWMRRHWSASGVPENWTALIRSVASVLQGVNPPRLSIDPVPASYGSPDWRAYSVACPAALLLDAIALSIGLRCVYYSTSETLYLLNALNSRSRREANLATGLLATGGLTGPAEIPSSVTVICDGGSMGPQYYTGTIDPSGCSPPLSVHAALRIEFDWGSPVNAAAGQGLVNQVAYDVAQWWQSGSHHAFTGVLPYATSGFDDYFEIAIEEREPRHHTLHSRIVELPPCFLPPLLLTGSAPCDNHGRWKYELTSDWAGSSASAKKYKMDGSHADVQTVTVLDPLGLAAHQQIGDEGHMVEVCGLYYVRAPADPPPAPAEVFGVVFQLTSTLAAGDGETATADVIASNKPGLTPGTEITVRNTGSKKSHPPGTGWAIEIDGAWWIVEVDQDCYLAKVTFSDATHELTPGGASRLSIADQHTLDASRITGFTPITPYPFSLTPTPQPEIANPYNLFAMAGDTGIVASSGEAGAWELLAVYPAETRRVLFHYDSSSSRGTGHEAYLSDVEVVQPDATHAGGEVPERIAYLRDPFNLTHKIYTGAIGIAEYDPQLDSWHVLACQHRARHVIGTLYASFSGAPATFQVSQQTGLDAEDEGDIVTVDNIYHWQSGNIGAQIRIEWDGYNERWIPVQMECP